MTRREVEEYARQREHELHPCPWCDAPLRIRNYAPGGGGAFQIQHNGFCPAIITVRHGGHNPPRWRKKTIDELIEIWNRPWRRIQEHGGAC